MNRKNKLIIITLTILTIFFIGIIIYSIIINPDRIKLFNVTILISIINTILLIKIFKIIQNDQQQNK
jgi:hypothetical protein